jgi:hypothetical protein
LERIAHLGYLTFAVIANVESATHLNERNTLELSTQIGMNAQGIVGSAIGKARHRTGYAGEPRGRWWARVLYQRRAHRMLERALRLTVVIEAKLVHGSVAYGPRMADVPLLESLVSDGSETRYVCPGSLELRERRDHMVVVEVVVQTEILLAVEPVIDPECELIAAIGLHRSGLERMSVVGWGWDKLEQVNGGGIQASKRNNVLAIVRRISKETGVSSSLVRIRAVVSFRREVST